MNDKISFLPGSINASVLGSPPGLSRLLACNSKAELHHARAARAAGEGGGAHTIGGAARAVDRRLQRRHRTHLSARNAQQMLAYQVINLQFPETRSICFPIAAP
mgnify:CR=1 FL=1